MALPKREYKDALLLLAEHSQAGALICSAVADGRLAGCTDIRKICTAAGLAQANSDDVQAFMETAGKLNLVTRKTELTWHIANPTRLSELAPMLYAIHVYRSEIHQDANTAEVVLSTPPKPSQLAWALEKTLLGNWGLQKTRNLLPLIAEKALHRFAVMTPYLDETGADIVLSLFSNAKAAKRKQLIIRTQPDGSLPAGLTQISASLMALGVEIYNFRLDKNDAAGYETFHAKVVLADSATAYVGSANMNKWSFQYSLELGLMVSGEAAIRIGQVMDAVVQVSSRVSIQPEK